MTLRPRIATAASGSSTRSAESKLSQNPLVRASALMAGCSISVCWNNQPPLCGKPAVIALINACIHEHISDPYLVCADCLAVIDQANDWECLRCAEGPRPHKCRTTIRRELVSL